MYERRERRRRHKGEEELKEMRQRRGEEEKEECVRGKVEGKRLRRGVGGNMKKENLRMRRKKTVYKERTRKKGRRHEKGVKRVMI